MILEFFTDVIRKLGKSTPYKCYPNLPSKQRKYEQKVKVTQKVSDTPRFLNPDYWPAWKSAIGATFKNVTKKPSQQNDNLRPACQSESEDSMEDAPQDQSEEESSALDLNQVESVQSNSQEESDIFSIWKESKLLFNKTKDP